MDILYGKGLGGGDLYTGADAQALFGQLQSQRSSRQNDDPPGWLQRMMNLFGFGTKHPRDEEEASEQNDRRAKLLSNNAKAEENMKIAEDIPIAGGLLKISKGAMGTFSDGKDYGAVVGGSASILGDILGGAAAKGVLRIVNGLKITVLLHMPLKEQ